MTKVVLTIEIDIPDADDCDDGDLSEMLFHEVVNYATVQHLADAVTWCANEQGFEPKSAELTYKDHLLWGRIMKNCVWSFKRKN